MRMNAYRGEKEHFAPKRVRAIFDEQGTMPCYERPVCHAVVLHVFKLVFSLTFSLRSPGTPAAAIPAFPDTSQTLLSSAEWQR